MIPTNLAIGLATKKPRARIAKTKTNQFPSQFALLGSSLGRLNLNNSTSTTTSPGGANLLSAVGLAGRIAQLGLGGGERRRNYASYAIHPHINITNNNPRNTGTKMPPKQQQTLGYVKDKNPRGGRQTTLGLVKSVTDRSIDRKTFLETIFVFWRQTSERVFERRFWNPILERDIVRFPPTHITTTDFWSLVYSFPFFY